MYAWPARNAIGSKQVNRGPAQGHQRLGLGFDHLWEASHVWLLRW
jgi:hypothetical protein